jgi:hypothetical protein
MRDGFGRIDGGWRLRWRWVLAAAMAVLFLLPAFVSTASGQLTRQRVQTDGPVENVFWSDTNIGIGTVRNLPAGNLNTTVAHTFGLINGGLERFFGMDDGANTRLGLDYGITDRLSVGIGRMTFNKVVDLRGKYNLLRQTVSGSIPLELAVKVSAGINTTPGTGLGTGDRMSYFTSILMARKFGGFSVQVTPMLAHFNRVAAGNPHQLAGLGLVFSVNLSERFALSAEYLPVIGDRNAGTHDAFGLGLNIDTGGHIFQLFVTTSQWHGEPYIMANNSNRLLDGHLRFGFNINRVFGTGR